MPDTSGSHSPPRVMGYRNLSDAELRLVNETKLLAEKCQFHIEKMRAQSADGALIDLRWLQIGTEDLQKGFMALVRSITKPTTF